MDKSITFYKSTVICDVLQPIRLRFFAKTTQNASDVFAFHFF